MRLTRSMLLALPLALPTCIAFAGEAEICYTAPLAMNPPPPPPDNSTPFNCPTIGNGLTLPQIAALGWQVVQLTPVTWDQLDPITFRGAVQLVVQKP